MSLSDAASSGDRLGTLKELRDLIARTIQDAEQARDVAALSRQLTDVLARIADLEGEAPAVAGGPVDPLDELLARREARGA